MPAWFTMDTRLGSMSVHLDTPQCFSAEMYAVDLNVPNASEELKVSLALAATFFYSKILSDGLLSFDSNGMIISNQLSS